MRSAALSVPGNIAEGNDRGSDRDGVRFLFIARASLAELMSHVEIVAAAGLVASPVAARWSGEAEEIARMLAALIRARGFTLDKRPL